MSKTEELLKHRAALIKAGKHKVIQLYPGNTTNKYIKPKSSKKPKE